MTITIAPNQSLESISAAFSHKFPYLKLRFFSQQHEPGTLTPNEFALDESLAISEIAELDHTETLSIDGHTQVRTFERKFQKLFGIGMQVMRHSGSVWLQTSATDAWTLSKQNLEGEMDSTPV